MQLFVLTTHCQSRVHCKVCRSKDANGLKWREALSRNFKLPADSVEFICPYGIPWNATAKEVFAVPIPKPKMTEVKTQVQPVQQIKTSDNRKRGCECKRAI